MLSWPGGTGPGSLAGLVAQVPSAGNERLRAPRPGLPFDCWVSDRLCVQPAPSTQHPAPIWDPGTLLMPGMLAWQLASTPCTTLHTHEPPRLYQVAAADFSVVGRLKQVPGPQARRLGL